MENLPENMTEEEFLETVEKVVNRLAHKFRFGFYDIDDIKQEATVIAIESLEKYDSARPLENFLSVHLRRRLINLKRNIYYCRKPDTDDPQKLDLWEKTNAAKQNLICPINIGNVDDEQEQRMRMDSDILGDLAEKEIIEIIEDNMPMFIWTDYLRYKSGASLPKEKKQKVIDMIKKIIYDETDLNVR